ncbi:hypothetical protein ACPOL_7111 (plasmid) [Acidisarcina polymorpha]|uniref:Uncharacterized protein n=1 Tax=Acidisarcina polymorpha TaxID=2211140 RepID=A0A2Z5GAS2_9BACT|nr:hypothetical protein ACPOL_7111 [Acidisarcina polymorpha]
MDTDNVYPSEIIDSQPNHLIEALRRLLGDALTLSPIHVPNQTGTEGHRT